MSGIKLYELDQMIMACDAEIERIASENEGVIPDDWDEFLGAIQMEKTQKFLGIGRWIKNLEAEAAAIREEEKKLATRRKTCENKADRILAFMGRHLPAGEKLQDANTVIGWRKSITVEIDPAADLPREYMKVEFTPIKQEIKKALQAGEQIPGCVLVTHNKIQIR